MLPEEKARVKIDKQLNNAGWDIVDRKDYLPNYAMAVKEALMQGGKESDYLLFVDNKAIGVVEAKKESDSLGPKVASQAEHYAKTPQNWYGLWFQGLIPLVYLANGNKIYFKNMLTDSDGDYVELGEMHSPKKMLQLIGKKSEYGALPRIEKRGLRDCQYDAEVNLEKSLKQGKKKALAVLATGSGKTYVQLDPAVIEQARQMDLLSYLQRYEPNNLKRVAGNVYCTKEHDSLKISNGKWYWWSRGFGGVSALDYLIKVKEYSFVEAVELLTGITADWKPPPAPAPKGEPKELLLPPKNKDCNRVTEYLFGRGIDLAIIQDCIADGTIFESSKYHNVVFIGKDESGTPKYAAYRGTMSSSFKGDASGSDKRYSFRLLADKPTDTVHLFEAAIDLLSYATYLKCEGKDYKSENLLSLSGVYQPKKEIKESKIPIALTTFLKANPHIKTIFLHLDNDKTGRLCTAALKELLQKDYKIVDEPPPVGKDFNDFLLSYLGIARPISSRERSDAR